MTVSPLPQEHRRFARTWRGVRVRMDGRIRSVGIRNVSMGGLQVDVPYEVQREQPVNLALKLPWGGRLEIRARVAWTQALPTNRKAYWRAGLEFRNDTPRQLEILRRLFD
jgi:hypothetical protein